MAHDVFISHSSNNRTIANAVCASLEGAGIRCWIAPRDVLPGRSYSGEITRAIQQSRTFILIFSEHSNNSEQVLREVQLAANSRLHIVQFRIDAVAPSDDLEYYLSGPHWLDAVTPPLETHLGQLKSSIQALLALPPAGETDSSSQRPAFAPPSSPQPIAQSVPAPPAVPPLAVRPRNIWKWVALGVAAIAALSCVAFVILFVLLRPHQTITAVPPSSSLPVTQSSPVILPPATAAPVDVPRRSVAPSSGSSVLTTEEAELLVKEFNRDMEHGDLQATIGYLDDTVDYYAFGPKPKAFIAEQLRQYFAAVPVRTFSVTDVEVQTGPKPTLATVLFDTHYSIRDALGNPATGRTHTEWDVVRRADGLKIVRTNWMTYPDAMPTH